MTDNALPSNETIEKVFQQAPLEVLARIGGDSIETREAKRLINITVDLVHQAREKAKESTS